MEQKPTGDELDFVNMVLMLGGQASADLGGGEKGAPKGRNLPRARQITNMLSILQKKTEGRLNAQEIQVLTQVLADLQEKYVRAAGLNVVNPVVASLAAAQYAKSKKRLL